MIYPNISTSKWVKKYNIDFDENCEECGNPFVSTKPYIKTDYAGVECFCESCDEKVYIYTPISQKMKDFVTKYL
jgi:hypothetical protein